VSLCLLGGTLGSTSATALTTGKVKKIVKKQIKKLVPKMIDAATLDQGTIPPVTASTSDQNKTIFTTGPFTMSLDCSDDGGNVNLKLLVRTSEEDSVGNASSYVTGDLDPADGDQQFQDYTGNPPGGEAVPYYPYNDLIYLRSPSGTHVYVQFDSATNFRGNDCFVDGWFFNLAGDTGGKPIGSAASPRLSAPLTAGKAKKVATKLIKKRVPGMIDAATIDQGTLPFVSAGTADPNKTLFSKGPFTVSLDCSLDGPSVELALLVRTTEENSVVNDASGPNGDLDPADGDQELESFSGSPPGGDAETGDPYDTAATFRSPSGTHLEVHFDTVTNFQGNHCAVDGWFVDLAGSGLSGGQAVRDVAGASPRGLLAPVTIGAVKKMTKKLIKKRVPKMIDAATLDQGIIPPVTASVSDSNKTILAKGPFTISLDCNLETGDVDLAQLARTSEENSVISSGWGFAEEVDPADGDVSWADHDGNAPGGDASVGSGLNYQDAVFRSPSGSHFYARFDAVTNYQGNHCFMDGWFLDLAG
jgi:hypothetical protein